MKLPEKIIDKIPELTKVKFDETSDIAEQTSISSEMAALSLLSTSKSKLVPISKAPIEKLPSATHQQDQTSQLQRVRSEEAHNQTDGTFSVFCETESIHKKITLPYIKGELQNGKNTEVWTYFINHSNVMNIILLKLFD